MSSRDELLNKAIVEAKESEDWQLVEWLRRARGAESASRWFSDKLREAHRAERKLLDKNSKLRELVRELYDELDAATQYDAGGGRGVVYEFADRMRELGVDA